MTDKIYKQITKPFSLKPRKPKVIGTLYGVKFKTDPAITPLLKKDEWFISKSPSFLPK